MNKTETALYFYTFQEQYARQPMVCLASRSAFEAVADYRRALGVLTLWGRIKAWFAERV